jgi:hypothetical protein
MNVGDTVRIVRDREPLLVGLVGTIRGVSADGTIAFVETNPPHGAWCSVSNLEKEDGA